MSQPWKHKEVIGECTLYLGDCMDIMPALGEFDAVVTDPPYGIGEDGGVYRGRLKNGRKSSHRVHKKKTWDKSIPKEPLILISRLPCLKIVWGGNYFSDIFPPSKCWLYWQKLMGGSFSDGELAWTNLGGVLREFTLCNKMHGKVHPTQKPVELMEWCINHLPDNTQTILDPFMGSGTTLVACAKMGRKGTGIELDPEYFEIACEQVQKAYDQPDMFVQQERVKPPENLELFGGGK